MTGPICILGGSGFVGTWLTTELATRGYKILVPTRGISPRHKLTSIQGVGIIRADIHDPKALSKLLKGCSAVINLVGILNEQGSDGKGFHHAHVELARKVIHAMQEAGVKRLLHMSALNADMTRGPSYYLRTKGRAEDSVMDVQQNGLEATAFRPSVIFGRGDSFFNRFATLLRFSPVFPLACPNTNFAPVWAGDVVSSFITALEDDRTIGQRYNLCGPGIYTLRELVEYTAEVCEMKRVIIGLPDVLSQLQARLLGFIPGKPMSYDNYLSLTQDSFCEKRDPTLIKNPRSIREEVPGYLCTKNR